jgi:hypothetical protein
MANTNEGSCRFTLQQKPDDFLDILVSRTAPKVCPPKSSEIESLGNWAVRCSTHASHGESSETISGQLRDIFFTITLVLHGKKDDPKQDETFEQIAEEVVGSLY